MREEEKRREEKSDRKKQTVLLAVRLASVAEIETVRVSITAAGDAAAVAVDDDDAIFHRSPIKLYSISKSINQSLSLLFYYHIAQHWEKKKKEKKKNPHVFVHCMLFVVFGVVLRWSIHMNS